jgi:hypothetical protein
VSEGAIVAIVEMAVQGTIVLAFGLPLLAFFLRRRERKEKQETQARGPAADPQIETRLARMETALDSIAIELERISEGQRFTTKLMSEKQATRAALPPDRSPE